MENFKPHLAEIAAKSGAKNNLFAKNQLKEYLQLAVLDFIYIHPIYSGLIFYGGSCLTHCFGLARLSEDLDFVAVKKINIERLGKDLENYFQEKTDLKPKIAIQKFRIYLKFPLLKELGLAESGESDWLFLKIEIFRGFDFCLKYETVIKPLFKFNRAILIRTFDLPTLLATKIRAIFYRQWKKTNKNGRDLIKVKGRDYFDLMWYLEQGIKPNLSCLKEVKNQEELKTKLLEIISKVDSRSIHLDLESLVENADFAKKISQNIKEILKRDIKEKL